MVTSVQYGEMPEFKSSLCHLLSDDSFSTYKMGVITAHTPLPPRLVRTKRVCVFTYVCVYIYVVCVCVYALNSAWE